MDIHTVAILDWLNTFDIPSDAECASLADLSDGYIISSVLSQIAPSYFEVNNLSSHSNDDWVLASTNIKKIIRLLDGYYRYVLRKYIDTTSININAIVKDHDPDEILSLLELVIGVAVLCEERSVFIQQIFALDHDSQTILKDFITSVMQRAIDITEEDEEQLLGAVGSPIPSTQNEMIQLMGSRDAVSDQYNRTRTGADDTSAREIALEEALLRAEEASRHLKDEQQRLLNVIRDHEENSQNLLKDNQRLRDDVSNLENDRVGSPSRGALESKSAALVTLQIELDELKREVDMKISDNEELQQQLLTSRRQWEAASEMVQKLTMDNNQMSDELEIAKDKANKLVKAEATIEKYQAKLEEMSNLKRTNKELTAKLDEYLEQINVLESNANGIVTLQRLVDQYKVKAVELEREKFESLSAFQMKEHENARLRSDVSALTESKRVLVDELGTLRVELTQLQVEIANRETDSVKPVGGLGEDISGGESIISLKEKVKKLEYELRQYTGNGATASGVVTGDLALLHAEVDDLKRIKKEREDSILSLRKQLLETQTDLQKSNRSLQESQSQNLNTLATKDAEDKLALAQNTLKLLEDKLKDNETTINKLEQEKSKLEIYARKTLSTFKDKFMSTFQTLQAEKKALEERLQALTDKMESNQETSRREERLLLSSMYELGMKIMDRNLHATITRSPTAVVTGVPVTSSGLGSTANSSNAPSNVRPVAVGNPGASNAQRFR